MKRTFRAGSIVGEKYEIIEYITEGSLGDDIYRCKQTDLDREVSLRIMPQTVSSDPEMLDRFIQEAKLTASLHHPNIITAHDSGEYLGRAFLVTESVKGMTLADYLQQRGELEELEALGIVIKLAGALDYAWNEFKILNRNIRPGSILLTKGDVPKLEDFGMAKSFDDGAQDLTMAGFTIGNPEYMSPEQVRGESNLDFRSDIYCMGLVLYQMLAGKPPYEHKSQIALMQAHLTEAHRPMQELNPRVHEATCAAIDKMLAKDKTQRHQSWKDVIAELSAALKAREAEPAPDVRPTPTQQLDTDVHAKQQPVATEPTPAPEKHDIPFPKKPKKDMKMSILIGAVIFLVVVVIVLVAYIIQR